MDIHSGNLDADESSPSEEGSPGDVLEPQETGDLEESGLPDEELSSPGLPLEGASAETSDLGMGAVQPVFAEGEFPALPVPGLPQQPAEKPQKKKLIKFFIRENQMKDLWRRASLAKETSMPISTIHLPPASYWIRSSRLEMS